MSSLLHMRTTYAHYTHHVYKHHTYQYTLHTHTTTHAHYIRVNTTRINYCVESDVPQVCII